MAPLIHWQLPAAYLVGILSAVIVVHIAARLPFFAPAPTPAASPPGSSGRRGNGGGTGAATRSSAAAAAATAATKCRIEVGGRGSRRCYGRDLYRQSLQVLQHLLGWLEMSCRCGLGVLDYSASSGELWPLLGTPGRLLSCGWHSDPRSVRAGASKLKG